MYIHEVHSAANFSRLLVAVETDEAAGMLGGRAARTNASKERAVHFIEPKKLSRNDSCAR